jgi:iron complex transport system substrate-binding protein
MTPKRGSFGREVVGGSAGLSQLGRREFLVGTAALGAFLVGCARRTSETPAVSGSAGASEGPWTFTDDRGVEISLPAAPDGFAAFSTSAAALAEFGITPDGIFAWTALEDDPQLRFMDLSNVTTLGTVWPEINLEKLAAIDPAFVATVYDAGDDSMYGFEDKKHVKTVEEIAPTLGIDGTQPLLDQIAKYQELAVALGADIEAEAVKTASDRFQTASDAVAAAAADNPGIKTMAVYPADDGMYVAQVEITGDLSYYESLGVEMVRPVGEGNFYWEILSWENADKHAADLIMVDSRGLKGGDLESAVASVADNPTWNALPAVQAGQLVAWHAFDPAGYRFYYEAMEELEPAIRSAQVVT